MTISSTKLTKETQALKPAMAAHSKIENRKIEKDLIKRLSENSYFEFLLREAMDREEGAGA